MPDVVCILFDLAYSQLHQFQDFRLIFVVDITLQQFEDIQPIARILYKSGEEHIEPIINRNKLVPVAGSSPQRLLKCAKALLAKRSSFYRLQNIGTGKASTIEGNAY